RAAAGDPVPQLADLRTQVVDGLKRAGAPEWLAMPINLSTEYSRLARTAATQRERMSAAQNLFRKELLALPFSLARGFVTPYLNKPSEQLPPGFPQLVLELNNRDPKALSGRDRQAWLLSVANMQRLLGRQGEAQATLASAGFDKDVCVMAESSPKLLEQHFSDNDYPEDLNATGQEGSVVFEFNLAAGGQVTSPRIVYSLPSGVFDEASTKGISTLRYVPPTRGGKAIACRGVYQPVTWRLQDESDVWLPSLRPPPRSDETS
ncbi:MAG TPA: energy transducer TonB, partial [Sphingomicrobium sp.]